MLNFPKCVIRYKTMTAMENESSDGNVSPKKKSIRKGKTALARVLLLDGSYLDVQIDVNIYKMNEFTRYILITIYIMNIFTYLFTFCSKTLFILYLYNVYDYLPVCL